MRRMTLLFVALIATQPAFACTINLQMVETGQTTATKSYALADSQCDRIVAAYQIAANAAVNSSATRNQVLSYWADQLIKTTTVQYVLGIETQTAVQAAQSSVTSIAPQ